MLCQVVLSVGFLQQEVSSVGIITQDRPDGRITPMGVTKPRDGSHVIQLVGNGLQSFTSQVFIEDEPDHRHVFWDHHILTILKPIAQHGAAPGNAGFEVLSDPPFQVF